MQDRFDSSSLRPTSRGRVVGLGLGKFRFVGSGVALLLAASTALAGPEGAKVREGRATITQRGNRTVIRTSDRAVIDYRSFDIGRNETVRFIQPGADSRVLNRIRSDRPTTIDGTIKANGRVYIVNPVGVIFSGSSVTDVAHLYAAAGNISNRDFMAGIDRFTGVTGDVTNHGLIRADSAALIGARVANSGIILPQTENGVVAMVSGSEVTLTPRGSSLSVKIDAANAPVSPGAAAAVENTGAINTRGGQALMAAGDLYALAIRNTGAVRARDVELRGGSGKVELSGQIDARDRSAGGRGGSVTVTGAEIALTNASIDASGSRAGGSVRIGGDAMGRGDLPHARTVSADSATTITADALRRGDGGSIVVYADDHTAFSGRASAQGGDLHGSGGFVETSGKNTLDISGAKVVASGKDGNGQWLLDPTDIVIDAAAATAIVAALDTGTDVTVETGSTGADAGNITVDSAIAKTDGAEATLTLRAANDITVNQPITSTAAELNVNLLANNADGGNTDPDPTAGVVVFNNDGITTDGRIAANGGDVAVEGVDLQLNGLSTISAAAVAFRANSSADQSIGVESLSGAFNLSATELASISANSVSVSTDSRNDAADIGAIDLSAPGYGFSVRAGSITTDAVQLAPGRTLSLRADAGDITVTGALAAPGAGGSIQLRADDISLDAPAASVTAESVGLTANADRSIGLGGPGDFALSPAEIATISATNLEVSSAGAGDVTVGNSSDPSMPIAPGATNVSIVTAGRIEEVAADDLVDIQVSGRLTLKAGTGIGSPGTDDGTGTGPLDIDAGELDANVNGAGGLFVKDTGGINVVNASTADGAVSIRSTGAINATDLSALSASPSGRTLELVASGGDIAVTGSLVSDGNVHLETSQPDASISVPSADISDAPGVTTTLITVGPMGNASITNARALNFADSAVGGDLSATAQTGNISDANTLTVSGASSFTTSDADATITLDTLDAAGPVSLSTVGTGGHATVVNAQALDLSAVSVGGDLSATASTGDLTNSAAATVGGVARFTTSAAGADIALTQLSAGTLRLDTAGPDGDASVQALGPLALGDSTVDGTLTLASTGEITNPGVLTVSGPASFTTLNDAGAAITLDNAMNTLGAVTARARNAADSADADGDITIAERSIPGNTRMDITLISTAGSVTLIAPDLAIDTSAMGPAVTAGAGGITLRPSDAGATIGLDTAADFTLDLAELQELSTPGRVTIGAADSGEITVGGAAALDLSPQGYDLALRGGDTHFAQGVTLAADRQFTLETGAITSADSADDVTIAGPDGRVVINSTGAVDLDISAARLAVSSGGDVVIDNSAAGLRVDTIDSVDGVSAPADASITLSTAGVLTVAAPIAASGAAVVTLNAADGLEDATMSGDAVTAPTVVLNTTAGRISGAGGSGPFKTSTQTLTASAPDGVNIANSSAGPLAATLAADSGAAVLSSAGSIRTNGAAWNADSFAISAGGSSPDGLVAINDAVTADNGGIAITANDLEISGFGAGLEASGTVTISRASEGTIGVGDITSEDLTISNAELAAITAAELVIGDSDNTTKITVRNVAADDTETIGRVTIEALRDNASIAFTGSSSTFNALTARADAGIEVDANLTADTGNLVLDADADMDADPDAPGIMGERQDQLFIHAGRVLSTQPGGGDIVLRGSAGGTGQSAGIVAEGDLNLDARQNILIDSAITVGGRLSLIAGDSVTLAGEGQSSGLDAAAGNGVAFSENFTSLSGNVAIDADADNDGTGALSIAPGKTLSSSNANLSILAADLALDGSIDAGAGTLTITRSSTGDIALGDFSDMAGRMTIAGDELGRITAANLTIGGGSAAAIIVGGVTAAQSGGVTGLTTLDAGTTLSFSGGASSFTSLRGNADQDITVSAALTTGGEMILSADFDSNDSGVLTISAPVSTGNSAFTASAADIAISAPVNAGTGDITISRSAPGAITVDNAPDAPGRMVINDAELANLSAGRLFIGGGATDVITVRNFSAADGAGIAGLITFDANTQLTFNGSSVFKSLNARSNNLVAVNANLATSVGDLTINGNANAAPGADDRIEIGSGRTIDSAGNLVLSSSGGGIEALGSVTLRAAGDVRINNDLSSSGETVVNADSDGNGSGNFILPAGTALNTTGSNLTLTAADLELNGTLITGGGAARIDRSTPGSIALGAFSDEAGRLTISGAELARIIATGLTIGGANTTSLKVNGVTDSNSNSIAGVLTLAALGPGGEVSFEGAASRFNALSARADQRIVTSVQLVTDSGNMTFDAGANTQTRDDGLIALGAGIIASSTGTATATNFFDVAFNSPVRLRTNVVVEAEDIAFNSRLNSASGQFRLLTLNSHEGGTTVLRGTVGGADRLAGLFTNADGVTRIGGDVFTTREGATFADRVVLINDVVIRDFGSGIAFGGTINSDSASTPRSLSVISRLNTSDTVNSLPVIRFADNVGDVNALRNIYLNYDPDLAVNGRPEIPRVATIVARPVDANGNFTPVTGSLRTYEFLARGEFRMGQNEKLAVGGNVRIRGGQSASLGDITALGNVTVNSPDIRLLRRAPGSLSARDPNRLTGTGVRVNDADNGLDFVSGGTFRFSSTPTAVGAGATPQFGTPSGDRDPSGRLDAFIFQTFPDFSRALIDVGNPIITQDLKSSGPSDTNFATALAGAIPRESRENDVSQTETVNAASFSELEQLGVFPRDLTDDERVAGLIGWSTYDDYPESDAPTEADFRTAVNRLPGPQASGVLARHQQLFYRTLTDEQTGEPRAESLAPRIKQAFEQSIKRFRAQSPSSGPLERVDPIALREFIERSPDDAQSLAYARQLQGLLRDIELLGLTSRELRKCKSAVLRLVRPNGLGTREQFEIFLKTDIRALEEQSVKADSVEKAG